MRFSILKSRQMTVALHQDQIAIKWLWRRLLSCGNPLSSHHPHLERGWHFYGNTKNTITRMIGILVKEFLFLFLHGDKIPIYTFIDEIQGNTKQKEMGFTFTKGTNTFTYVSITAG